VNYLTITKLSTTQNVLFVFEMRELEALSWRKLEIYYRISLYLAYGTNLRKACNIVEAKCWISWSGEVRGSVLYSKKVGVWSNTIDQNDI